MPEGLGEEMDHKKAVGHLAGLFVGSEGKPVTSPFYERCGISADAMCDIASKARKGVSDKDSVLIATQDEDGRRLETISAVLEGGYVSTLVTDASTAQAVLASARPKRRSAVR
jgi:DNA-binding transcriptional regulator LsrR (DeoR family)